MKEKGFTMIEVLVALTLFSLAVTGVLTVTLQGGLTIGAASRNITASYLAQEGVELMRARRDSRILTSPGNFAVGWGDFVSNEVAQCSGNNVCDIEAHNPLVVVSCPQGFCPLVYNTSGQYEGYYTHTQGSSNFSRSIKLTTIGQDEVQVEVRVNWVEGSANRSVIAKESLFNWYD